MTRLDNKSIIVTGAGSGIGAAICRAAHDQGAVVGLIDINLDAAQTVCESLGSRAFFAHGDVTDEASMNAAFTALHRDMPRINGCVTSAGILPTREPIADMPVDAFQRVLNNHITGTFITCKVAGNFLHNNGGGAIVTLSSVLALRPGPVLGYGAGKAAIVNLTQSLAVQWSQKNIRINTICPGWVDTPFIRAQEAAGRDLSPIINMTPIGRLIRSEEIANVALFLLSDLASAVTGAAIVADGGITLAGGYLPYGDLPS
ncbi:MAG: SDR family NAD(P)-dependent oxidoreductase [Candidatus Puniceispirillum sp.]|jgi:NAD(P)-dependent dehydrogenase (short-subunit alcohol dehydrogenase family)